MANFFHACHLNGKFKESKIDTHNFQIKNIELVITFQGNIM